ncbi:MAG: heparinase II/III-family protein [Bacteroidales bacterium]|nr:heparinase II/III-family protein [Bacteroidales bacterium]
MRKTVISVLWCLAVAFSAVAQLRPHQAKELEGLCATSNLKKSLVKPMQFAPVPKYKDAAWQELPDSLRKGIIKNGRYQRNFKWEPIDLKLFAQFKENGNRTNYETPYFRKRGALNNLALAELLDAQGTYLPQVEAGIRSLLEEEYWGLPAHYSLSAPSKDLQTLDLFSAETASQLSWVCYVFEDVLPTDLVKQVKAEVKRRVVDEAINKRESWRGKAMNWNPWICSNWLACVLFAEPDRDTQIKSIQLIAESLDGFLDGYPDDGGCDEGPSYYDRAGGSLFDCLVLLDMATDGAVNISNDAKLKPITEYPCVMNIDNVHCVDFADASPLITIYPVWHLGAEYVGSDDLKSIVARVAASLPADNIVNKGCGYSTNRQLLTLDEIRRSPGHKLAAAESGEFTLPFDAWLPNTEIMVARSVKNSADGLYVGAKGGNNGESHNHNDVGSFIVYADGQPLLIDIGRATYDSNTFNSNRYKMNKNTQSAYHNLPLINGVQQMQGEKYKAKNADAKFTDSEAVFTLDIAGAYLASAKVDSWVRTIDLKRNQNITVTEDYKLSEYVEPSQIVLVTPIEPVIGKGKVTLGRHSITFDKKKLKASSEPIDYSDDSIVTKNWPTLYRVFLTPTSNSKSNKIQYVIQ